MPYKIEKQGDKWCVVNKDTGKNAGCSDTEAAAKKHMAALYANVSDAKDYEFLDLDNQVWSAWWSSNLSWDADLAYIFPTYIIVRVKGFYKKVSYTTVGSTITFSDKVTWQAVEPEFVPTFKGIRITATAQPIRSLGDGRYGCYAVMFGDEENRDLYKQFFTKSTDFCLDWYEQVPWLYHHGLHPSMGAMKIGTWDSFKVDDIGVFVEGERLKHHKYEEAVGILLDEGILYPSSGAAAHLVEADDNGQMLRWPIVEVSSTVSPAEYRMGPISAVATEALKSMYGGKQMAELNVLQKFFMRMAAAAGAGSVADIDLEGIGIKSDPPATESDPAPAQPGDNAPVATAEAEGIDLTTALKAALEELGVVDAIKQVDAAVQALDGRMSTAEDRVKALGQNSMDQVRSVINAPAGGDLFEKLWSASRAAEDAAGDGAHIDAEGILQPGETVLSHL